MYKIREELEKKNQQWIALCNKAINSTASGTTCDTKETKEREAKSVF